MTPENRKPGTAATPRPDVSVDAITHALQTQALDPFEQIIEAVDLHFWLMDLDPVELVYASPATLRAWGTSAAQKELRAPRIHPQDVNTYAALFSAAAGQAQEAEYRVIEDDGQTRWRHSRVFPIRDVAGNVIRIAGVTEDVTVRKRAEHELAVHGALERLITTISAELVNLSAPQMDDAFLAALGEFASVIEADYAGIALLEESDGMLRVRWQWRRPGVAPALPRQFSVVSADDLRAALDRSEGLMPRPVGALPPELAESEAILLQSGVRSVVDAPLRSNGKVIGVLGFATTDERKIWPPELPRLTQIAADMFANAIARVRNETAMRAHLDQLAHVLRLGTMGQLASGMAHELNQPLAAIMNYVRACERGLVAGRIDTESVLTAVRAIGAQATRAADVIKALRALVKAESSRERGDLSTLVRAALRLLESEASRKGIRICFDAGDESVPVYVDVIQVQQVILNLVQNAFDAIDASGAEARVVYVSIRPAGAGVVEVSVRDTGPGVAHGKEDVVFEDFYTTKPQGLGLGLSISHSLIEAHGGRLWLDRNGGTGACFRFTLPAAP
jgi:PAS domain S-box-containing protein